MRAAIWPAYHSGLFVILTALRTLNADPPVEGGDEATCPDDVERSTHDCMIHYNNRLHYLKERYETYYMGPDVETLRSICQAFKRSVRCARKLKEVCQETEHAQIQNILSNHLSVIHLCWLPNLYEQYARNQNCFAQVSTYSWQCYQTFRADAESMPMRVTTGEPEILPQYCSHVITLIDCIRRHVRINCKAFEEAEELVSYLVRPSVELSEQCRNDSLVSTTTQVITKTTSMNPPTYQKHGGATSRSNSNTKQTDWLFLLLLLTAAGRLSV